MNGAKWGWDCDCERRWADDRSQCGPCQLRDHASCDGGDCACDHLKAKRTDAERVQVVIRRMRHSWTATDEEREMTDDEWADAHPIGPDQS